jgi:N-acetylglutamate synthase-like GNAT family acetyltransferase
LQSKTINDMAKKNTRVKKHIYQRIESIVNRINKYEDGNVVLFHGSPPWGETIDITIAGGIAHCRAYMYVQNEDAINLDSLSVHPKHRGKGHGTHMQELREQIGRELGCKEAWLWVDKDKWMFEWYKRRGYEEMQAYEAIENHVWMRKLLN